MDIKAQSNIKITIDLDYVLLHLRKGVITQYSIYRFAICSTASDRKKMLRI